jgi:AbrB family looped-hinge helix DNA binding protein
MSHYQARMTSKGQITLPAPIRRFFGLQAGDMIDFYLDEGSRTVRMRVRNQPASVLMGALNGYAEPGAPPLTQEDIDKAIGDHLAEEAARITREAARPSR